jgi:hypothetical protein
MENLSEILNHENTGMMILVVLLLLIGAVAKWRMFIKCNQPGIAAIVPVYDVVVTLRLVGRPAWQIVYFLIPVFNLYFGMRLLIEIAQSFGKRSVIDYIFVLIFNLFYLLNLGLAYNEEYQGPVYKVDPDKLKERDSQYATA